MKKECRTKTVLTEAKLDGISSIWLRMFRTFVIYLRGLLTKSGKHIFVQKYILILSFQNTHTEDQSIK